MGFSSPGVGSSLIGPDAWVPDVQRPDQAEMGRRLRRGSPERLMSINNIRMLQSGVIIQRCSTFMRAETSKVASLSTPSREERRCDLPCDWLLRMGTLSGPRRPLAVVLLSRPLPSRMAAQTLDKSEEANQDDGRRTCIYCKWHLGILGAETTGSALRGR
jgi:hypothetical protein